MVGGEPGHERLWLPLDEQMRDVNFKRKAKEHHMESSAKKRLKAATRDDFLNDKATMSEEEASEEDPQLEDIPDQTTRPPPTKRVRPQTIPGSSDGVQSSGASTAGSVISSKSSTAKGFVLDIARHEATQTVNTLVDEVI